MSAISQLNAGLHQCAVSKTLTLFRDISDSEEVIFSFSINSTVNNIARALFFSFLFFAPSIRLTGRGIWLQLVWGLCRYCLYMGTFQLGALILFVAGQWDIRSRLHNGHRHSGITNYFNITYDLPLNFSLEIHLHFHCCSPSV